MNQDINIQFNGNKFKLNSLVEVAQNELFLNPAINRGLSALCDNDDVLNQLNRLIFNSLHISDYTKGTTYSAGDLVWYKNQLGQVFLLKCIRQDNVLEPDTLDDDVSESKLNASGWENQNRNLNILDYYIGNLLSSTALVKTHEHEQDTQYHPFGRMSLDVDDNDYIGNKLLKKDLSNINPNRSSVFFPEQMKRMSPGYATVTGYMRSYGDKIVEYDIVFKLGSSTVTKSSAMFDTFQTLSANNVTFQLYAGVGRASTSYQTNKNYFFSTSDMDIFQPEDSNLSSQCALLMQIGRNDYVNTYSAKITFPKPFVDNNYMVFSNSVLSQTLGGNSLVPSANEMTYCDKTKQSIVFLDITFPDSTKYGQEGYNAQHGGLASNSFHCKIIGRIGV